MLDLAPSAMARLDIISADTQSHAHVLRSELVLGCMYLDGAQHSRCKHPAVLHRGPVRASATCAPSRHHRRSILLPKYADQNRLEVYPKLIEGRCVGEISTEVQARRGEEEAGGQRLGSGEREAGGLLVPCSHWGGSTAMSACSPPLTWSSAFATAVYLHKERAAVGPFRRLVDAV